MPETNEDNLTPMTATHLTWKKTERYLYDYLHDHSSATAFAKDCIKRCYLLDHANDNLLTKKSNILEEESPKPFAFLND